MMSIRDIDLTKETLFLFLDKFYPDKTISQKDDRYEIYTPKVNNLVEVALHYCILELISYDIGIKLKERVNGWDGETLEWSPEYIIDIVLRFDLWELMYGCGVGVGVIYEKCHGRSSQIAAFKKLLINCIYSCIHNQNELPEYVIVLQHKLLIMKGALVSYREKQSNYATKKGKLNNDIKGDIDKLILVKIDLLRTGDYTPQKLLNEYLSSKFQYFIENREDPKKCPTHLRNFFKEYLTKHKSLRVDYCCSYYLKNKINKNNSFYRDCIKYIKNSYGL